MVETATSLCDPPGMDPLDDYLAGVRTHGGAFCGTLSEPPWSLRITTPAPLSLVAMPRGRGWLTLQNEEPVLLEEGTISLVQAQLPITVSDRPGGAALVEIDEDNQCTLPQDGRPWQLTPTLLRDGEHVPGHGDLLVTASYRVGTERTRPLLRALPLVSVVHADGPLRALLEFVVAEVDSTLPGQRATIDRYLDLLLVQTLRVWFDTPGADTPAGYRALADPGVGQALRALHKDPARPWAVAALAAEAGMSRTAFARRFTTLVGSAPLGYLTEWRMTLAADALRSPEVTIASVARQVGYNDAFAFSAAFKRVRGVSPSAHRALARSDADAPSALTEDAYGPAAPA